MSEHDEQPPAPQLRAALDQAANALAVPADWDDLVQRRVRRERRGRRAAVALALVVSVLTGGIGYALGTDDGEPARVTARDTPRARDGLRAVTTTPAPFVSNGGVAGSGVAMRPSISGELDVSSQSLVTVGSNEPLGRAFVRTNDGVTLRTYRGKVALPTSDVPWFDPPGWCFPSGVVYVGASTELAVGTVYGETFEELRDGKLTATASVVGLTEDDPMRLVVAQVPAGASRVEARFPGGAHDAMAPIDGVAVLAAKAPDARDAAHRADAITVDALGAGGGVLSSVEVRPSGGTLLLESGGNDAACRADQQLPPPGKDQPANVEQARAAVVDVVRRFSDGSVPPETRAQLLDDSRGFLDIQAQIAQAYGQQVTDARAGATIDVVFTSATRAAVRFSVVTGASSYPFLGEVVLTDAGWRVTRDTWCHEISLAGKQCP
jgi:hypothetical protein